MLPRPLLASPPADMDHVTVAAPPDTSVAENCSTAPPDELLALQPAQLVSMLTEPGVMLKVPLDALLLAIVPPPQPASKSSNGNAAVTNSRKARDRVRPGTLARNVLWSAQLCFVTRLSSINSSDAFTLSLPLWGNSRGPTKGSSSGDATCEAT